MDSTQQGHGGPLASREARFTRLLPKNTRLYAEGALEDLAQMMIIDDDELKDGADAEENLAVPAGYTYLGQLVDHDLTFDAHSNFGSAANLRTPALDLDCLYGAGPEDQPYLYAPDGVSLLPNEEFAIDLLRWPSGNPTYGVAVIGDKRNDENSIICQLQLVMIKFHNAVVRYFHGIGLTKRELFERARQEVTWTYQRIVLEDYLRRVVNADTYCAFTQQHAKRSEAAYKLYKKSLRTNLPIEFVGAAYRFGHTMVRTGYRLNTETKKLVFDGSKLTVQSLVGFQPLPTSHLIDHWGRFFTPEHQAPKRNEPDPADNNPGVRLQWAYRIDPSLVSPLKNLPPNIGKGSLAALNLKRGNLPEYALATGQDFAAALGIPCLEAANLMVRFKTDKGFSFQSIGTVDARLLAETPLWFYILAEAQVPLLEHWNSLGQRDLTDADFRSGAASQSQLGPVGGRILMEVFNGLIDADERSFRGPAAKDWKPLIGGDISFWNLLKFAELV